jgi:hypothetical protein
MIEGHSIPLGRGLGFTFRNELIEPVLVSGLFERDHAATVPHGAENVASASFG